MRIDITLHTKICWAVSLTTPQSLCYYIYPPTRNTLVCRRKARPVLNDSLHFQLTALVGCLEVIAYFLNSESQCWMIKNGKYWIVFSLAYCIWNVTCLCVSAINDKITCFLPVFWHWLNHCSFMWGCGVNQVTFPVHVKLPFYQFTHLNTFSVEQLLLEDAPPSSRSD